MNPTQVRWALVALVAILLLMLPLLILLAGEWVGRTQVAAVPSVTIRPFNTLVSPIAPSTTPSLTPMLSPSPTPEPSLTPTIVLTPSCPPPGTPEPLWVDPVLSPTTDSSQLITISVGRGRSLSIISEAGTVKLEGQFSFDRPVELQAPLLPDRTHNLVVVALVEYAPGCFYTLQTRVDRNGRPLVIVQVSSTPTPLAPIAPSAIPGPTLPAVVYLQPFSQLFAVGQPGPNAPGERLMYQGGSDLFQVLDRAEVNIRLQWMDSGMNFWTASQNLVAFQPPAPQLDYGVRGRLAQLTGGQVLACEVGEQVTTPFGRCLSVGGGAIVTLVARTIINGATLYLIDFGSGQYVVPVNALIGVQ